MKVIDLLNKIANGEEVPEYINYKDRLSFKKKIILVTKENIIYILDKGRIELTDVVEIPKKEKKIPENLDLYEETQNIIRENNYKLVYHDIHKCIVSLECKYNEIIDYLESKGDE